MKRRSSTELTKDSVSPVEEHEVAPSPPVVVGPRKIAVVRRKNPATDSNATAEPATNAFPQFSFGSATTTSTAAPSFSFGVTSTASTTTPNFSFGTASTTTETPSAAITTEAVGPKTDGSASLVTAEKSATSTAAETVASKSDTSDDKEPTTKPATVTAATAAAAAQGEEGEKKKDVAAEEDGKQGKSVQEKPDQEKPAEDRTGKDAAKGEETPKDGDKDAEKESEKDGEKKKFVLHSKPLFPFSNTADNLFGTGSSSSAFGSSSTFGSSFSGGFGTGSSTGTSSAFGSSSAFGVGSSLMSFSSFKTEESAEFGDNSAGFEDLEKNSEWDASSELNIPKVQEHGGDEDDETVYTASVKCYQLDNGEYKERGIGELRVNKMKGDKPRARLLMRLEKTQKLIVNDLLMKDTHRSIQNEKFVRVSCIRADASIATYLFRVRNATMAQELLDAIDNVIAAL